jgi:hypothetical protein
MGEQKERRKVPNARMRGYINIIHTDLGILKMIFIIRLSTATILRESENSVLPLQIDILLNFYFNSKHSRPVPSYLITKKTNTSEKPDDHDTTKPDYSTHRFPSHNPHTQSPYNQTIW